MSKIVQLIINGVEYPRTSQDKYKAYPVDLGESLRMASGKLVFEKRGQIMHIDYSYDYMPSTLRLTCLQALYSGEELDVSFLIPGSEEIQTGTFRCTKFPAPPMAFALGQTPYWHNFTFSLEGVYPL